MVKIEAIRKNLRIYAEGLPSLKHVAVHLEVPVDPQAVGKPDHLHTGRDAHTLRNSHQWSENLYSGSPFLYNNPQRTFSKSVIIEREV